MLFGKTHLCVRNKTRRQPTPIPELPVKAGRVLYGAVSSKECTELVIGGIDVAVDARGVLSPEKGPFQPRGTNPETIVLMRGDTGEIHVVRSNAAIRV